MKIVVFGPERRVGALVGEKVIDLNRGMARQLQERGESKPEEQAATRLPSRLLTFIESGASGLENAQRVIEQFAKIELGDERGDPKVLHNSNDVKLHAPWPERRIACVGGNYAAHLAGMWANRLGKTDVSIEQITEEAKKGRPMGVSGKFPRKSPGPMIRSPSPSVSRISIMKAKSPSLSASAARTFPRHKSVSMFGV